MECTEALGGGTKVFFGAEDEAGLFEPVLITGMPLELGAGGGAGLATGLATGGATPGI